MAFVKQAMICSSHDMLTYSSVDPENCQFISIGAEVELSLGKRLFVEIDQLQITVFQIADHYYAIADVCSHDDGPLGDGDLEGYEIICPRHGARFDIRNGKVTSLPAVVDIPSFPVRVVDGQIEVGIPNEI